MDVLEKKNGCVYSVYSSEAADNIVVSWKHFSRNLILQIWHTYIPKFCDSFFP